MVRLLNPSWIVKTYSFCSQRGKNLTRHQESSKHCETKAFNTMAAPEQNSKAWYDSKIEKVPEDTREILEKYSGIAPQDVTSHIEAVVSRKPRNLSVSAFC